MILRTKRVNKSSKPVKNKAKKSTKTSNKNIKEVGTTKSAPPTSKTTTADINTKQPTTPETTMTIKEPEVKKTIKEEAKEIVEKENAQKALEKERRKHDRLLRKETRKLRFEQTKKDINQFVKNPKVKKAGYVTLGVAGTSAALYGGKKIYDKHQKDKSNEQVQRRILFDNENNKK